MQSLRRGRLEARFEPEQFAALWSEGRAMTLDDAVAVALDGLAVDRRGRIASATMDFNEQYGPWALIAGASEGLGAAFADECASRGCNVVLVARRQELMEETAAGIRDRHGVETRTLVADLGRPDIGELVASVTDDIEVGFFVYNAAAAPQGLFVNVPLEEHLQNIAVNVTTPTVLSHMLGQEDGGPRPRRARARVVGRRARRHEDLHHVRRGQGVRAHSRRGSVGRVPRPRRRRARLRGGRHRHAHVLGVHRSGRGEGHERAHAAAGRRATVRGARQGPARLLPPRRRRTSDGERRPPPHRGRRAPPARLISSVWS